MRFHWANKEVISIAKDKWVIIGLGNPGEQYSQTRHNVGFMAINHLCRLHNIKLDQNKCQARIGEGEIHEKNVVLAKPTTFMNLSGKSVAQLCNRCRVPSSQIIIIYDDVNLPAGKIRVRSQGSSGGHNGIQSIIACLGTKEFPRIRIGIGSPSEGIDMAEFVLSRFEREEMAIMDQSIELIARVVDTIIIDGVESAMNKYNQS
ncbi:MAG: aminoacyl-tRNA hydrolase [Candidatus Desantisbacteria bacterium]